ncbi:hypothetical protein [Lentilactobacillus parakefiri]|uniref:Uncharacterized protein n=1 Tax=Lentilactobacillus parakefiri TaxID=152332 RepID=A0A224VH33_9LACO|nr:hypothetical protein [Lentilactobacillus parakefiri]PAK99937.1 hypothetical protein B8W96_09100 [Lentilactobacillus parakefiri]TDG89806.1 hypothetical protein C5L28_001027 [Lentilactobacillus parakefiri]GAW73019.1 hypothetical protein LPKJCM_02152 [Lentilactobacillus parakefiri]
MPDKRRRSHKIRSGLLRILGVIILLYLLVSISPSNSVRMTIALIGHPKVAMKVTPVHDSDDSSALGANIYTIPVRDAFNGAGISHLSIFEIHTILIFHIATPTYDHLA